MLFLWVKKSLGFFVVGFLVWFFFLVGWIWVSFPPEIDSPLMEIDWVQFSYREYTEEFLQWSIKWAGVTSSHCNKSALCLHSCNFTFRMQILFLDHWPGNFSKTVCLLLLILNNSHSLIFARNNEKKKEYFESIVICTEIVRMRKRL